MLCQQTLWLPNDGPILFGVCPVKYHMLCLHTQLGVCSGMCRPQAEQPRLASIMWALDLAMRSRFILPPMVNKTLIMKA